MLKVLMLFVLHELTCGREGANKAIKSLGIQIGTVDPNRVKANVYDTLAK
jgi:hypothetical protein